MCSCNGHRTDFPPWRGYFQVFVWRHRDSIRAAFGLAAAAAALAGLALYWLTPTDIERAETDLRKARAVVNHLEEEGIQAGKDAHAHAKRTAEYRTAAGDNTADAGFREWCESMAHSHKQLSKAKWVATGHPHPPGGRGRAPAF